MSLKLIEVENEIVKGKNMNGKLVEGVLISRMERTMTIRDSDGNTHFCWTDQELEEKKETSPLTVKCRVVNPHGDIATFNSMSDAARAYEISLSAVSKKCKDGTTFAHGKMQGYRFEKVEAVA